MFNVKDILAAVRVCVLGVLLFAPLTSHALPANDNHVALPDAQAAAVANAEECRSLVRLQLSPLHTGECERECGRVYDDCSARCGDAKWCVLICSFNHSFCMNNCNAAIVTG